MKRDRALPLATVLALVTVAPIFAHPTRFATTFDWRYFEAWIEAGRRSILWWHQMPLWNPWVCGGQPYLANPQSLITAPVFLLPLVFGTPIGVKLILLFYYICAYDGTLRAARSYGLRCAGSLLAAVLFGAGGWMAVHFSQGHLTFTGAALFPYMIVCYRRALQRRRWLLPLAGLIAWQLAMGGTSTPLMAALLLGTLAVVDACKQRALRPLMLLGAAAVCAMALGAIRVLPTFEFIMRHPRDLPEQRWNADGNSPLELLRYAFSWSGIHSPDPGKKYWYHEYGFRMAWLGAPLMVLGLRARRTRGLWWVVGLAVVLALGNRWPHGPWWLLHQLPVVRGLRVPSRYLVLAAVALPLLAGEALDQLCARLRVVGRRRLARALAIGLISGCAADGIAYTSWMYARRFTASLAAAGKQAAFFQVEHPHEEMLLDVLANHGALTCLEEAPLDRARKLDVGAVPQFHLAAAGAGQVLSSSWSPNRLDFELELARPTLLVVNQNWAPGWQAHERSGAPLVVGAPDGKLGVELPSGRRSVELLFRPRSFIVGAAATALSLPLAVALFVGAAIRERRTSIGE